MKAIYRLRFEHTTVMLCRVLHVNRSTYYNFINKRPSKREVENQRLRKLLLEIYMKAKKRIGTRAFKIILLRDYGVNISEGRILRLLKSMTLPKMSTIKPRFKSNKSPVFSSDNLLKQEFNPNSPNQVWTTDFTYISIGPKRHVYLCAILDLYSRKCTAWKVSDRIDAKLACDTLEIAINKRKPKEPIIFHSDQGSQFKSASFRKLLDEHQLLASYSKPGYPYDNAVTEVFFKYLKQREINRRTYHSIQEVQLSCFEYIEQFYNNYNPHSANNGLTPSQKEENYFKKWKGYNKLDTKLREIVERFIMARRKFDKQFKNSAVKLILEEGYSVKEVSQELEVHANSLYRWVQEVEEYGESAFPGNGTALADAQHKIKLLEKENRYLQEELELLKKFRVFLKRSK